MRLCNFKMKEQKLRKSQKREHRIEQDLVRNNVPQSTLFLNYC